MQIVESGATLLFTLVLFPAVFPVLYLFIPPYPATLFPLVIRRDALTAVHKSWAGRTDSEWRWNGGCHLSPRAPINQTHVRETFPECQDWNGATWILILTSTPKSQCIFMNVVGNHVCCGICLAQTDMTLCWPWKWGRVHCRGEKVWSGRAPGCLGYILPHVLQGFCFSYSLSLRKWITVQFLLYVVCKLHQEYWTNVFFLYYDHHFQKYWHLSCMSDMTVCWRVCGLVGFFFFLPNYWHP